MLLRCVQINGITLKRSLNVFPLLWFMLSSFCWAQLPDSAHLNAYSDVVERLDTEPEMAMELAEERVLLAQNLQLPKQQAKWLLLQAKAAERLQKYDEIIEMLNRALNIPETKDEIGLVIEIYVQMGDIYRYQDNYAKSEEALDKALELATKSDDAKRIAQVQMNYGHRFRQEKKYKASIERFTLALESAEKVNNTKIMIAAYRSIGQAYHWLEDIETSVSYFDKALALLSQENDLSTLAVLLDYQAKSLRKLGRYGEALRKDKRALRIQRDLKNEKKVAQVLLNISIIHRELGDFDKALEYTTESLSLYEKLQDINGIAATSNAIGQIYYNLGRLKTAQSYYKKTLSLDAEKIKVKYRVSAYRETAQLLNRLGENAAAIEYIKNAESLLPNKSSFAMVSRIKGDIYRDLGQIDNARQTYLSSLKLTEEVKYTWNEVSVLIRLADLEVSSNEPLARDYLERSVTGAKSVSGKKLLLDAYAVYRRLEKNLGNFRESLRYAELSLNLIDEIDRDKIDKRIAEQRVIREVEKREQELLALKRQSRIADIEMSRQADELEIISQKNKISNLELKNERILSGVLISLVVLGAIIIALLAARYRLLKRMQGSLEEKNAQVETKNLKLESINETKNRLFTIIAHDLRNPMSALISLSELLKVNIEEKNWREVEVCSAHIHTSAMQTHKLLDQLLEWAMSQLKEIEPAPKSISLRRVCQSVSESMESIAKTKNINIRNLVHDSHRAYADENMIATVVRNLLSNGLKYTPHDKHIELVSTLNHEQVCLHVRDYGIGISEDLMDRLFTGDFESQKGIDGETGFGIGLAVCREFIEKNGGELTMQNYGNGAEFSFTLPCVSR